MCDECWKEFRGWCRSFTVTELVLALLETVLLVVCVVFLVFLIGHFIACGQSGQDPSLPTDGGAANGIDHSHDHNGTHDHGDRHDHGEKHDHNGTHDQGDMHDHDNTPAGDESLARHMTLSPKVNCTWKPSDKTDVSARYYAGVKTPSVGSATPPRPPQLASTAVPVPEPLDAIDRLVLADQSDGEQASPAYRSAVLALARRRGGGAGPVLGCPLTALSEHWALTAASCLDAVEEADALHAYLMVERWGSGRARWHAVADVRVHPRYGGRPAAHDAAALRSPDPLLRGAEPPRLPSLADYFLITIGERFTVLGFGPFRSLDNGDNELREVHVYSLNPLQCAAAAAEQDAWAARHLRGGAVRAHGACAAAGLCAGALQGRAAPCGAGQCAGSPLLRGPLLLGVAGAGPAPCGEACDPLLYGNLALIRDWIDDLLLSD